MACSLFPLPSIVKQSAARFFVWLPHDFLILHVILTAVMDSDIGFMQEALKEARSAAVAGEVPIGAVLVRNGRIIARSGNLTIRDCDPTAHAEMIVLRDAARVLGHYPLAGANLYVTRAPCRNGARRISQRALPRH